MLGIKDVKFNLKIVVIVILKCNKIKIILKITQNWMGMMLGDSS